MSAIGAWLAVALAHVAGAVARFRSGPTLPWISAHRMLVLIVGALLVSGTAFAATAAVIAQPPVAEGSGSTDDGSRPRPASGFVMPSPVSDAPDASTAPPSPSPTPEPTGSADDPAGEPAPVTDPEPTTDPVEPTEEPDTGNGRPDPPGASNRPDKPKD
ncbi:hypothetical protein [Agromyces sp. ZXT2-3]|uniref:hypothetical protein n=1 Tax=Agromyces sp. ZXT2-3 TaxID=3461152 RepID=UPI004054F457